MTANNTATARVPASAPPVANLYPPHWRAALVQVRRLPAGQRLAEIDRLTDQLVHLGWCRPRDSLALFPGVRNG